MEWSGWDTCVGQCRHPPGNSRGNDEHICEAGVCFSVRSMELEGKEVSGSYDSLCEQV